jgi:thiol-disulfide isomerase/thioredoxin
MTATFARTLALATLPAFAVFPSAAAPALPVQLEAVGGEPVAIEAGSPALHLVFFATWCPPCVEELPALADLEARWRSAGYRLVLVAVPSRQTAERLASFAQQSKPPGKLGFDASGTAQRAFGVDHLPAHVVLDKGGNELYRSGKLDDGLRAALQKALGGGAGGGKR